MSYRTTVVGSYPRPDFTGDTLKKPTLTDAEVADLVTWAARDQASLGLDTITDGEGYRENMYYFYQRRLDGVSFENMPKKAFGSRRVRHRVRSHRWQNKKPPLPARALGAARPRRRSRPRPRETNRH